MFVANGTYQDLETFCLACCYCTLSNASSRCCKGNKQQLSNAKIERGLESWSSSSTQTQCCPLWGYNVSKGHCEEGCKWHAGLDSLACSSTDEFCRHRKAHHVLWTVSCWKPTTLDERHTIINHKKPIETRCANHIVHRHKDFAIFAVFFVVISVNGNPQCAH